MNKWFKIAWRSVIRNKRRSLTALLTIAIASTAMTVAYGYLTYTFWGLKSAIIQGGAGHYQVVDTRHQDGFESVPLEFGISQAQADALTQKFISQNDVKLVLPRIHFSGLVSRGETSTIFSGTGVHARQENRLRAGNASGAYISGNFMKIKSESDIYQIELAKDVARRLDAHVDDTVTVLSTTQYGGINAIDAVVAGIYTTGIPALDAVQIKAPIQFAQELLETDKVSRLVVQLRDLEATDTYRPTFKSLLDDTVMDMTWYELEPYFIAVQKIYRGIFSFMGVILITVVLLSVSNVLSSTVLERVSEIGTLRAFGITRGRITMMFMTEGLIIGIIGVILGLIISVVVILVLNNAQIMMPPPPGRSQEYPLMVFLEPMGMAVISFIMCGISVLASRFAVKKVVNKKVVEQLQYA